MFMLKIGTDTIFHEKEIRKNSICPYFQTLEMT